MTFFLITLLWLLAAFLVLVTVVPFTKIAFGAVQAFAFPREQFLFLALICGGVMPFVQGEKWGWIGAGIMAVVAVIQGAYIVKFTPIWSRQSMKADAELAAATDRHISVLAANIKLSNRQYDRLIDLVRDRDPDIVMAIEVDQDWINALKTALAEKYEHWVEVPRGNGYGMCLMSRLPLADTLVRDLVTKDVPSIRTQVTLPSGQKLRLYVLHPEPPIFSHDTIGRDSEIALVGLEAADDTLPAIVTGDLNDVAWSTTTRRFQRLSGLLDPRVGRGFYNTFSATIPLMRWPLDHLFHDPKFRLIEMARERKIASDHFPMWFALALAQTEEINSDPGKADAEEVAETKQMIKEEQGRTRDPIGGDWEKG